MRAGWVTARRVAQQNLDFGGEKVRERHIFEKNNDFLHFFYEKICRVENLLYICIVKQEQWWIHLRARIHASHA